MANETNTGRRMQLSRDGANKLQQELEDRRKLRLDRKLRLEITQRIETARSFGDLSENGEYDAARNEQSFNEGRIQEIERILNTAVIADATNTEKVGIGTRVTVYDEDMEEEETYTVVGATESDPAQLRVSTESPVGLALMDHRVGETVQVETPGGTFGMRILAIEMAN